MEKENETELRLAALCRSLGHLWSEDDIVNVRCEMPVEKRRECTLTLYGKKFSKPNVNFQALQNTMKKAWKTDTVTYNQKAPGFYSFLFKTEAEKEKVLSQGPWLFANNLLVLKQCVADIPEHCYEFTKCAFWVQIVGIPPRWIIREVYSDLAAKIGKVLEIQLQSKGVTYKTG
ncbi:hypothetical protein EUGRSUZ_J02093 [Eucalyptus grandis]|uniref:DUF4283 domain-containing protein n=2 Tax=Eucalyptus grandis TaxID=71139 RepID=A0A059AH68_EUCGR|nr:hypothetical protein EUGRSUZ_J02093 [Eucalyptus grandis]